MGLPGLQLVSSPPLAWHHIGLLPPVANFINFFLCRLPICLGIRPETVELSLIFPSRVEVPSVGSSLTSKH
jgi:hypothetical protein